MTNLWKRIAEWPRLGKVVLFLVVMAIIVNVFFPPDKTAVVAPVVAPVVMDAAPTSPPEIDIKRVASASRAKVEQVFGVPAKYEVCCDTDNDPKFSTGNYPWGEVTYHPNGKVSALWYHYKTHPHSVDAALRKVGLEKTSEPVRLGHVHGWCPDCRPSSPALLNGDLRLGVAIYDDPGNDGFGSIEVTFLEWAGNDLLSRPAQPMSDEQKQKQLDWMRKYHPTQVPHTHSEERGAGFDEVQRAGDEMERKFDEIQRRTDKNMERLEELQRKSDEEMQRMLDKIIP